MKVGKEYKGFLLKILAGEAEEDGGRVTREDRSLL